MFKKNLQRQIQFFRLVIARTFSVKITLSKAKKTEARKSCNLNLPHLPRTSIPSKPESPKMIAPFNAFISYSHKDEWLKDEFIEAMSALSRSGKTVLWDDRRILAGKYLETEISKAIHSADVMFLLVSSSFIASDYCMEIEFKKALELNSKGQLYIVPIIVRECDYNITPLEKLNIIPADATPVNPDGAIQTEHTKRDSGWAKVISEIKRVFDELDKKKQPIKIKQEHIIKRKNDLNFDHNRVGLSDLATLYQEPELSLSIDGGEIAMENTADIFDFILSGDPVIIGGDDKSGKSTLLYRIQEQLGARSIPSVILKGDEINNNDLTKLIKKYFDFQIDTEIDFSKKEIVILIDDLDECKLSAGRLSKAIGGIIDSYKGLCVTSFSSMNAVMLREGESSEVTSVSIETLPPNKIYELVEKWCELGAENKDDELIQNALSKSYQSILKLLHGGAVPTYPGIIISFLKVLDAVSGTDLATTSNAACYDSLITIQLGKAGVPAGRVEVLKNFLGHFAGVLFEIESGLADRDIFDSTIKTFETSFFESLSYDEEKLFISKVLNRDTDGQITFNDKFILYLFVGRYFSTVVKRDDPKQYEELISTCIENVRYRSYANILLYSLYFSNDVYVLDKLTSVLDQKFSEIKDWKLSKDEEIYTSISKDIFESLKVSEDFRNTRLESIQKNYSEYKLPDKEGAEAYISPFSNLSSTVIVSIEDDQPGTFIGDMNSLFRMQSIICNAINTRQGTFKREIILKCVDSLIKSAGRFAHSNLNISRKLLGNMDVAIKSAGDKFPEDDFSYLKDHGAMLARQKAAFVSAKIQDEINFHSRWSIISSQGVLGRVLSQNNTNIALKELYEKEVESIEETTEFNYNYLMAYGVSSLWNSGKIDREFYDDVLEKHGDIGFVRDVLSFSIFIFSKYMPISVQDRQWLSTKLHMKLQSFRVRQRKLTPKHQLQ